MPRLSFLLRLPILLLLAHAYVALRLAAAAPPGMRWTAMAATALIYVLILGGFFTRRTVGQRAGDAMAWAGFIALGFFSWLFVLTLLRDVLLLLLALASLVDDTLVAAPLQQRLHAASALAVPLLALLAGAVGLFNARRLARVVDVAIALPGLPPALHGFTIVQLSDIHVGPTIKRGYIDAIVDAANALEPDLIALTGDLVDGSVPSLAEHTRPLGRLAARHGVYVVTGNHEYYSGAIAWVDEFRRLGLRVLMNQHEIVRHQEDTLLIAGVNDYSAAQFDATHASDPKAALRGAPADVAAKILLAHQPRSAFAAAAAGFDLQLSGHTHGGQFWPWKYFVPLQQPFVAGLHRQGGLQIYVSRGTGYWGPPLRLGAPSEITRIRLRAAP